MQESVLFNNTSSKVIDDLRQVLTPGCSVCIAAKSFSIFAYEALRDNLDCVDNVRFIYTEPAFEKEKKDKQLREFIIPRINREKVIHGCEFEIRLRNPLTQRSLAHACAEWVDRKCTLYTNTSHELEINEVFVVKNFDGCFAYLQINHFATDYLGLTQSGRRPFGNIVRLSGDDALELYAEFETAWNDSEVTDITENVKQSIGSVCKENTPEYLYMITLQNLFCEFLDAMNDDFLPKEGTGYRNSVIWQKLYNFQKDAVLGIINKLETYNGCILADSVGLGKTFTALAVIKYYESRNMRVLVLCPKKLAQNWNTYCRNYKTNPLEADRFSYTVLFHTDLSRNNGASNGIDLSQINWSNFDLVVIDESHYFRNGTKNKKNRATGDVEVVDNRYQRLLRRIISQGVKTKVLMLSATPVNNNFNDLRNQLQLAYEGKPDTLNEKLNTSTGIDEIFKLAQKRFNEWSKLPVKERLERNLQDVLDSDFFKVLDAVTIARSRKHIAQFYDTAAIGKFPTRLPPINRSPSLCDKSDGIKYHEIFTLLQTLHLKIYTPSQYILPQYMEQYLPKREREHEDNLTLAGREEGIRHLMSINIFKRMESSINSFRITVKRLRKMHEDMIALISEHNFTNAAVDEPTIDEDEFDDELDINIGHKTAKIQLKHMDYISWQSELKHDIVILDQLLEKTASIDGSKDAKLMQLKADIDEKISHPLNNNNHKIIIFTAFADTAQYLFDGIGSWALEKHGLHTALINGSKNTHNLNFKGKIDFDALLSIFSPCSKELESKYPEYQGQSIDILIATDCISEGQNLQDCDCLINFDIHWNPVRIIQRFGRIDRIGSKNERIQLINYWPDISLDEYIKLKQRVESRMEATVMTSTGDDNPLSSEEANDLEYRKEQLKRLRSEVVDLEDMSSGISILDLGLNQFKNDLIGKRGDYPELDQAPHGLHAIVKSESECPPGVIFVLKSRVADVHKDTKNQLHPFYLIYMDMKGNVVANHLKPKRLLDLFRKLCFGKIEPDHELCDLFNHETDDGIQMQTYSDILNKAVRSVVNVKNKTDVSAFLTGDNDVSFVNTHQDLRDFELIDFLVIK